LHSKVYKLDYIIQEVNKHAFISEKNSYSHLGFQGLNAVTGDKDRGSGQFECKSVQANSSTTVTLSSKSLVTVSSVVTGFSS
jgi:hypothetical protein